MKNWFNRNYRTLIISTFLIPIITVAVVSISHVTKWYGISNPFIWAAYLSIGIEIAALSALAAISANMGKNVYFPFGIVTLIQFIGNIYYTYFFIEIDSKSFISWVELVSPLIEFIGVESTDLVGHKRFLAVFSGGMLPLISLSFLHMLVKFTEEDRVKFSNKIEDQKDINSKKETNIIESKELISEVSRVRFSEEDLNYLENFLLKKNNITKEKEEIIEDKTTTTIINPEITDEVVKIPEPISVSFNTLLPNIDVIEQENIILEEEQIEEENNILEEENIILEEEQIEEDNIVQEDEELEEDIVLEEENIVQEEEVEEDNIILEEEQMEEENIVQEEENIIQEENSNITVESEEKKKNHS
jgi:hypothetical protein